MDQARANQFVRLFCISLLVLFVEVACIRWISVELTVMRVFPNLTLTAILIGFSIGLATAKEPLPSTTVLLLSVITTFGYLTLSSLFGLSTLTLTTSEGSLILLGLIGAMVLNLTFIFVTLGRALGREFEGLPTLQAYGVNIAGSIAGVVLFALLSLLSGPPAVWIAIAAGLVWFLTGKKYVIALGLALAVMAGICHRDLTWSPYGKVQIVAAQQAQQREGNYDLLINGDFFHGAMHMEPLPDIHNLDSLLANLDLKSRLYRAWLELPYLSSQPKNVLILGSGSGNDVSCAVLHGVKTIDAVEINPVIASCGYNRHPDKPYADPHVNVFVEDARTFLRYSQQKYDLIEFAYLDPGHIARMSSFLRSDNFVYTKESIASALEHLTADGVISVSFATGGNEPATRRLYKTIADATGKAPQAFVYDAPAGQWGSCFFLFGPGAKPVDPALLAHMGLRVWPGAGEFSDTQSATDNWPFLYLEYTPAAAVIYLFVLLSATALPVLLFRRNLSFNADFSECFPMFFLGLAFMLMETKAITKLSLLFGTTWIVSSVVILSILCLASLANWIADHFNVRRTLPAYVGLTVMLIVDYFFQIPASTNAHPVAIALLSAFITCAPVFFGGLIFSTLLNRSPKPVVLLSANVLGVAFGGLLENLCIVIGIRGLSLIALGLYLCSGLPALISTVKGSPKKAEPPL